MGIILTKYVKRRLDFSSLLVYNLLRKVIGSEISDAPVKLLLIRNKHLKLGWS